MPLFISSTYFYLFCLNQSIIRLSLITYIINFVAKFIEFGYLFIYFASHLLQLLFSQLIYISFPFI